jgi:thiol-disulfide isomerase/thioredoxin
MIGRRSSSFRWQILVGCVALLHSLISNVAVAEVDILDYRLRDLATTGEIELSAFRGTVNVLMFFEPECPYCFRQARVLNELREQCGDVQPIAIGVNGDRSALQNEMRRMRADFPTLQIDARLQEDIGEVVATPLLLLSDRSGMLVTWLRGLQQVETLRALIDRIDPDACIELPSKAVSD